MAEIRDDYIFFKLALYTLGLDLLKGVWCWWRAAGIGTERNKIKGGRGVLCC